MLFRMDISYFFRTITNSRSELLSTRPIQTECGRNRIDRISSLDSTTMGRIVARQNALEPKFIQGRVMGKVKAPKSLRFEVAIDSVGQVIENNSGKTVSAVAGLIAVASFSGAEAQQTNLPPVTVDAPVARPRPAASKPSPDQVRARSALRRAAHRTSRRRSPPCRFPMRAGSTPTAIPTQTRPRPTWPPGCRRQANFPSRSSTRRNRSRC